jgi:hypothetical protein
MSGIPRHRLIGCAKNVRMMEKETIIYPHSACERLSQTVNPIPNETSRPPKIR